MKNLFVSAGLVAISAMLFACGDSSSSASTDREDVPESSSVEESSSSVEESSSSVDKSLPKGARVATLDDLGKNMYLDGLFKTTVYMATGSKNGVFSLWVPDTVWIGIRSDFDNGTLVISKNNAVSVSIPGKGIIDSMNDLVADSTVMKFIVNADEQLQYSIDGKKYNDVIDTTVKTTSNILSSGDSLSGKILSCEENDSLFVYTFYDGRYIMNKVVDKDTVSWSAGVFDIQRSKLLMIPVFMTGAVPAMRTASVSKDYTLGFTTGVESECDVEKFKFKNLNAEDFATEWDASVDKLDWEMILDEDGTFELIANKGLDNIEYKKGVWDVYGDQLLMLNTGCKQSGKCELAIKGPVSDFDAKSGFVYENNSEDSPAVPTEWQLPQYE
ncbi:MAG: hypothetical protein MJY99_05425 [Fibrobacter sp.]|uniref:hypothetical protein n=1 Tax=Fibrobacter sp. TaxID=35828 RepID=UPI00388EF9E3|nr:hypothetical protein [Fibrobacter sp.]